MGISGDETTGLLRSTAASITRKSPIPTNVPYQRLHTDSNGSYHTDYGTSLRRRGYRTTSLMESLVKQVVLSWHELTVTHKKSGRVILDHVSGMAEPGQFVALMGASGAGKTTLLNALIARNLQGLHVQGEVLVDGRLRGGHITNVSGYVQQDELFVANLTVREHLEIQARLRLVGVDEEERTGRIDSILEELGLWKCQYSKIGSSTGKRGISGGEAKRLLFAGELLNNPPLLFCDEPTTGLDSFMAESVVNVMRNLVKAGRTIICTIHQPSSIVYRKFDKVMFLARGRVAYFGEPMNVIDMLSSFGYICPKNYNPADMVIETLSIQPGEEDACKERVDEITTGFQQSPTGIQFIDRVESCRGRAMQATSVQRRKTASCLVQIAALLQRSFLDNLRNPSLARAKIAQKFFMGLFVGLLYFGTNAESVVGVTNLNGALFYIVGELTYATLFGIVTFLPADYPLLVREYHDGLYYVFSYYVSRVLSYLPLFAVDGLVMVTIAYWMSGLAPNWEQFLIAAGIGVLVEQSATAFGVMISTVSPNYPVAISVAGPLITVLSLTGGMFANIGELPVYISWAQYISWFRYGFEALAINQWTSVESDDGCVAYENARNGTRGKCLTADAVLAQFAFHRENFYFDLIIMFVCLMAFYAIGLLGLWARVRRAR